VPESGKRLRFSELVELLEVEAEEILRRRDDLEGIRIVDIDLTKRHVRHENQG
jgi:hypothetical protein